MNIYIISIYTIYDYRRNQKQWNRTIIGCGTAPGYLVLIYQKFSQHSTQIKLSLTKLNMAVFLPFILHWTFTNKMFVFQSSALVFRLQLLSFHLQLITFHFQPSCFRFSFPSSSICPLAFSFQSSASILQCLSILFNLPLSFLLQQYFLSKTGEGRKNAYIRTFRHSHGDYYWIGCNIIFPVGCLLWFCMIKHWKLLFLNYSYDTNGKRNNLNLLFWSTHHVVLVLFYIPPPIIYHHTSIWCL
jgi:hypothetical protein